MLTEKDFSKLYEQYYERSISFVRPYVREEFIVEEVVSEAFIKLWETLRKEKIENPTAYLTTILKNKALDHLRSEEKRTEIMHNFAEWQERELAIPILFISNF